MTSNIQNLPPPLIREICEFLEMPEIFKSAEVCKKWQEDNGQLIARTVRDEILPSFPLPDNPSVAKAALKEEQTRVRNLMRSWFPSELLTETLNGQHCCFTTFKNRVYIAVGAKIEVRDIVSNEIVKMIEADKEVSHFTHMEVLNDHYLAVACERSSKPKRVLRVVDMRDNKLKSQFPFYVTAMKAHGGILFVGTQRGHVYSLDSTTPSGKAALFSRRKGEESVVHSLAANATCVVISRNVGQAMVHDRKSKEPINAIASAGTIDEIFHLRQDLFSWGNLYKEVFVQDLTQKRPAFRLLPSRVKDEKAGVNFLIARYLFARFGDLFFILNSNALRLYDLKTRAHLQTVKIEGRKEMKVADGKLFVLSQRTGENSKMLSFKFNPPVPKKS